MSATYATMSAVDGGLTGAIDLVYSPDEGGWYAQEYCFVRKTDRVSKRLWPSKDALIAALDSGKHRFEKWPSKKGGAK